MKRIFAVAVTIYTVALLLGLGACAAITQIAGTNLETQIVTGANAVNAAAQLATLRLKDNRVTVAQAKGYSAILHSASDHLNTAGKALAECRTKTTSQPNTVPDPCIPSVAGDISLAIAIASDVQKTLEGVK